MGCLGPEGNTGGADCVAGGAGAVVVAGRLDPGIGVAGLGVVGSGLAGMAPPLNIGGLKGRKLGVGRGSASAGVSFAAAAFWAGCVAGGTAIVAGGTGMVAGGIGVALNC
jgi:hypothetical protein